MLSLKHKISMLSQYLRLTEKSNMPFQRLSFIHINTARRIVIDVWLVFDGMLKLLNLEIVSI